MSLQSDAKTLPVYDPFQFLHEKGYVNDYREAA